MLLKFTHDPESSAISGHPTTIEIVPTRIQAISGRLFMAGRSTPLCRVFSEAGVWDVLDNKDAEYAREVLRMWE